MARAPWAPATVRRRHALTHTWRLLFCSVLHACCSTPAAGRAGLGSSWGVHSDVHRRRPLGFAPAAGACAGVGPAPSESDIEALDAASLRRLLTQYGQPTSGRVAKLREQLREAIAAAGPGP